MFIHALPDDGGLQPHTFWANLHERNSYTRRSIIRSESLLEPEVFFRFEFFSRQKKTPFPFFNSKNRPVFVQTKLTFAENVFIPRESPEPILGGDRKQQIRIIKFYLSGTFVPLLTFMSPPTRSLVWGSSSLEASWGE